MKAPVPLQGTVLSDDIGVCAVALVSRGNTLRLCKIGLSKAIQLVQ